jgi:uncharacterized membrane protein
LAVTLAALSALPDIIPAHYGIDGAVTRWGSKYETLVMPVFSVLFGFFWCLMNAIALKERDKAAQNLKVLFFQGIPQSKGRRRALN